ncbi:ACL091Cp [Eremothecium gossypii ATCC 10895]|uniref:ACL091Cp n=1 Tax=Eremothecium gossypii (strain ATCC 10895 / CBS 109.51 / FGSC 9923 / NRRL Y-1056) TaxID=284811 RepID=Q75CL0_EREGS|nr:ACL091Cp [Eremothecium gossypii ATCC 10895]AAS51137.1 ACL091Cp [Eremothecium gossypii ATCC 10895]
MRSSIIAAAALCAGLVVGSGSGNDGLQRVYDADTVFTEEKIVADLVEQLVSLSADKNSTSCEKCVGSLALGKVLALSRPHLVPKVFEEWCLLTTGFKIGCEKSFRRNTLEGGFSGSNFVDMLALMDPHGYDGHLYCHYYENGCPKPETPNVTLSHLWPEKQAKHFHAPEPSGEELINVLHVSDFHIQLDYKVGSEAQCNNDFMCCTPFATSSSQIKGGSKKSHYNSLYESYYKDDNSFVKGRLVDGFNNLTAEIPATTFGHYYCDAPEVLVNSSLISIVEYSQRNNITFDFALFTGDLVDHRERGLISYEMTVQSEEVVFRDIKAKLKDIPLYAVLGNHDSFPYGQLAQENSGFKNKFTWNAELMADLWEDYGWIDREAARQARSHYTGFAINAKPGLKVISLNSNVWFDNNRYAYINASQPDTFGQFEFLINELLESEAKDQRVWIIAHIPPNSDALPVPTALFSEIVERFSPYTIGGIFFGHTHFDQFELLYAGNGTDTSIEALVNFAWVAPSVTPWYGVNPSWRYYAVDAKTFSVMNSYTFYVDLKETFDSNGLEPTWELEYDPREAYKIDWPESAPLNATYWHKVSQKMKNDTATLQLYSDLMNRHSPLRFNCTKPGSCDNTHCLVSSFNIDQRDNCKSLHQMRF